MAYNELLGAEQGLRWWLNDRQTDHTSSEDRTSLSGARGFVETSPGGGIVTGSRYGLTFKEFKIIGFSLMARLQPWEEEGGYLGGQRWYNPRNYARSSYHGPGYTLLSLRRSGRPGAHWLDSLGNGVSASVGTNPDLGDGKHSR